MRNPLRFWLGTLTVFLLALIPSVVPVGGSVVPAEASNPTCSPSQSSFTGNGTVGTNGVVYTVERFSTVGTCDWTVPTGVSSVDYLIVAGGGGGGGRHGGGGGAGGMVTGENLSVTAGSRHVITVGAGGLGSIESPSGDPSAANMSKKGGNSVALGLPAAIGGGPGAVRGGPADRSGGSGGGSDSSSSAVGSGTALQGNNGGQGIGSESNQNWSGGGGGGAGAAGSNATSNGTVLNSGRAGAGGAGRSSSITGTAAFYAGGGGGGTFTSAVEAGAGGTGGGGAGGRGAAGTNGTAGTGGGGGAGGHSNAVWSFKGGDGGSGVVVIRYVTPTVPGTVQNFVAATRFVDAGSDTDSVSLSWSALTGQTPAVTQYEIEYSTSADFSSASTQTVSVTNSAAATPNSTTISNLVDGARYHFRIKARNALGTSASATTTSSRAISIEDFALDFDGTPPSAASAAQVVPATGRVTVEAWIKPDSADTAWRTVFFQGSSNSNRLGLWVQDSGTLHVARNTVTQGFPVGDLRGQWSHVALTADRSTNEITLYLNGSLVHSGSLGTGDHNGTGTFYVGRQFDELPLYFTGQIDQVKVWTSVLTQAQVEDSMHSWDAAGVTGSPSLLAHYDFNDNTQATAVRDMAGARDLTLQNGAVADFRPLVERNTSTRAGHDTYQFTRSYLTATGGWTIPTGFVDADVLIVGGGGGGGGTGARTNWSGGGGAGGAVVERIDESVTAGTVVPVLVGTGGFGGSATVTERVPTAGGSSTFGALGAAGGGRGGHAIQDATIVGSNYPAGDSSNPTAGGGGGAQAGRQLGASGSPHSGGAGFASGSVGEQAGGGGAGAGGSGANASSGTAGSGGVGVLSVITSARYGGGGGGGKNTTPGSAGAGGNGGGGAGGLGTAGVSAGANTGGGGGGGGATTGARAGGSGGSGVVVVSFSTSQTVTFNKGTATGASGADRTSTKTRDIALALPDSATANGYFTRTGFSVTGWSENADGSTLDYGLGANYTSNLADTLYPVWTANTYAITWDSNSGSSVSSPSSFTFGASIAQPTNPTRDNKVFLGWSTSETSNQGDSNNRITSWPYTPASAANLTLYAIWADELMAYEPFSGTADQNIVGGSGSGSSGLTGNWSRVLAEKQGSADSMSGVYSSVPGLALPPNTRFTLPSGNTALSGPSWHLYYSARALSTPISFDADGTYYFTYINHMPRVMTYWGSAMVGLLSGLPSTDADTTPWSLLVGSPYGSKFGIDYGNANRATWVEGQTRGPVASGTAVSAMGTKVSAPTDPSTAFFVLVKIETVASGNDRISLRAFSPSENLPADDSAIAWDVTYSTPITGSGTHLAVEAEFHGTIDEFRLGYTYDSVTGVQDSYVVTYDAEGGTAVSAGSFFDGQAIASAPTAPTRTGYTFVGWSATRGGSTITFPYSPGVSSDVTLYAKWTANSNTVTFKSNYSGGASDTTQAITTDVATSLTSNGFTRPGYTFAGWATSSGGSVVHANGASLTLSAPLTLHAVWTANSNTVTFKSNYSGGASDTTQAITTDVATSLTSNAFTRTGYTFAGWATSSGGSVVHANGASLTLSAPLTLHAVWTANTYVVTFNKGSASGVAGADRTSTKTHDVNLALPDSATANTYFTRSGFAVSGWSVNANGSTTDYALGASYTTEAIDTLYPVWTANTYVVTFNKGSVSGAAGSDQTATKTGGVSLTLPNSTTANTYFTRSGFTVTGWSVNANGSTTDYALGASYTTEAIDTLYPVWSASTFTVTFNKGSASGATGTDQSAAKTGGVSLTLPNSTTANTDFTKTGYTVTGWSINADGSTSDFALGGAYTTEASDTLYPVWTPNTYTVTYTYNSATGGNSVSSASYTVDGIRVSLPTPTKTGFTFDGWYSNAGLTTLVGGAGASYAPTGSVTLYAKWTAATFTVIFEYNGATAGNADDDDEYTTGGTAITLPTPTKPGYTFGGWYSDVTLTSSVGAAGASYQPTANLTIFAKWTAITRTVTYNSTNTGGVNASSGSVPTDSGSYIIGNTVVVKANSGTLARTGYTFAGWVTNADGTGTALNAGETLTVAEANINLYPKWSANTYTITYNKNGGAGDLSGAPSSWQTGTSNVTLPNSGLTKTGFNFDGWQELGSATKENFSYQPNYEDVTLVARWNIKSINYTFDKGLADGLSITGWPSNSSANFASTITLPNLAGTTVTIGGSTYLFFGWKSGGTTYNSGDSYVMTETAPIFEAQWVRLFDVRFGFGGGTHSVAGDGASECDTGGLCVDGEPIVLRSAPERPGYTFSGWKVQDTNIVKAASTAHNVTATGYLFYAQWTAVSYRFTFNSLGGTVDPPRVDHTIGQVVTMPSPGTRTGYSFGGWSADGGSTTYIAGSSYVVGTEGQAFSAQWIPDVYAVTYDWQGGVGSTPRISDTYTVGTGDMTLPTASGAGYSRDGYNFSGWSTSIGGPLVSGFRPTSDDVLYAIWADGNYTLSYDPKGGTIGSGLGTVSRGGSVTLPTPVRDNFTFVGWFTAATGGTKLGDGGASFTPSASSTLFARWVQDSLYGVDLATLETASTYTASNSSSTDVTLTHDPTGTSARVQIPSGALPNGTVVTVRYFKETNHQSGLIPGDNTYFFALLVSWLNGSGDSATVPNTAAGKPITVTLENTNIKAGALVYQVIGERVTELGRATVDGSVTVELTEDPQLVVAATTPSAPTSVSGTAGDTRATVSWTAGNSGGSAITGYTVTASPGGATCSTASTSCTISSLSNNTAYTFRVVANNALGTSTASSPSSAVTPVGATYSVTFDASGGSSVSNGSFFSGSTVSAPTNPSRSGFTFAGWSTTEGDATTRVTFPYAPGVTNAITLYALWTVAPVEQGSRGGGNSGANNQQSSRAPVVPPGRTTVQPQLVSPLRPITAPIVIVPERGFDPDAGSKATVGGQSAPVTKTTPQDGGVSVGVGRVQVDISPTSQQGPAAPSAPGRATDLSVSTGQSAIVSGGGLLPGSVLQVWLPGVTGGAAKELARIPVKSDGSFVSELSFTPQQTGTPVPIGRQVLQVTGFDERGNQTVVDMTIMIAQGAPAPEPNRTTGSLPGLLPGQSLATSAGVPESVVVEARPSTQEVAVISGDWSFTVGLPETRGSVEESDGGASIIFEQQQTATVSGQGFQPDTRVDIWLFSDPTLLGSVIVAADGSFSGEVYLDPNFAVVGEHTLQLQGVGMDGFIRAANLGVVVEVLEAPTSDAGSSVLWWVLGLSALVALLIAIAILASRRGRRALH